MQNECDIILKPYAYTFDRHLTPMSKFSIIIPVYNVAAYLRECLDSVLGQSFADWEVICVDDGSTDGSGAILDEYAARDERFRIIHQPNAGVSAARNAGLETARGEWLWFVDADDAVHPDALEWLNGILTDNVDYDAIRFGKALEGELLPKQWASLPSIKDVVIRTKVDTHALYAFHGAPWKGLVRSSTVGAVRFLPHPPIEDALFMTQYFWTISKWAIVGACPYFYRMRTGSAIHVRASEKRVEGVIEGERKITESISIALRNGRAQYADIQAFLIWKSRWVFFLFYSMFWKLDLRSWAKCKKAWVRLQWQHAKLCPQAIDKRILTFLVAYGPSFLAWGWMRVYWKIRRIGSFLWHKVRQK